MSNGTGAKSKYEISTDGTRGIKQYLKDPEKAYADTLLKASSDSRPPVFSYRKESRILETLTNIPESHLPTKDRLFPRIYNKDDGVLPYNGPVGRPPSIEIEHFSGPNYRDLIIEAIADGKDPLTVMGEIPIQVANINKQMNSNQDQLIKEVCWGNTRGLKIEDHHSRRVKIWHYMRAIVYSMSPDRDVRKIRERSRARKSNLGTLNRDMRHYFKDKVNINSTTFTSDYVDRENRTLYGIATPEQREPSLLKSGDLQVSMKDLAVHHIWPNGKFIDFDEACLASGIFDIVSSLYNMYTYPQGTVDERSDQEFQLASMTFEYVAAMKGVEPKDLDPLERLEITAKATSVRLSNYVRLFGLDCKLPVSSLRFFLEGMPQYDEIPDSDFRQAVLDDFFLSGLHDHFIPFFTEGPGWKHIFSHYDKHPDVKNLMRNMNEIDKAFTETNVFKGIRDEQTIANLESLLAPSS